MLNMLNMLNTKTETETETESKNNTSTQTKLLFINNKKMDNLHKILSHNKINLQDKTLNEKIKDCDDCLQYIFDEVKAPQLFNTFCQECTTHNKTKYHNEELDVHLLAVGIIAESIASIFYDKFSSFFISINILKDEFCQLSKRVGLLHDIAKPFARVTPKENKKSIYIGHAQIGSKIINQIEFEDKLINEHKISIEWAINHHMCSCTHMNSIKENLQNIGIHMLMDLKPTDMILSFGLLSVLSYADHLGRLADDLKDRNINEVLQHSFELFEKLIELKEIYLMYNPSIINELSLNASQTITIITYGLSGSGKSYFANVLKNTFIEYDIIICERDKSLYTVYEKYFGSVKEKTYEDIYSTIKLNSSTYNDINNTNTNTNSINYTKLVQNQWVQDIADAYETNLETKGKIVILDSVQPLFPTQFAGTINSLKELDEDAYNIYINSNRIGYYSIPIHMFGNHILNIKDINCKTGKKFILPDPSLKGFFFPNVLLEKEKEKEKLDKDNTISMINYGSGSINLLLNYIQSYFDIQSKKLSDTINKNIDQKNLCYLLNKIITDHIPTNLSIQTIFNKFHSDYLKVSQNNLSFISYKTEIKNRDYEILTFTYRDGLQSFNGTTRDYRGESVIYSKGENKFYYLRPSLPVFPEMSSIQKDSKAYPYLIDIWHQVDNFRNPIYDKIKTQIIPKKINKLYLVPKFDGSLFNLTFIHNNNPIYHMISSLISDNGNKILNTSYYFHTNGIFLIGSKGTVLSKDPINKRIHNAICGSYDSIDQFFELADEYLNKNIKSANSKNLSKYRLFNPEKQIINLHFEAIDAIPTDELTVYYGKAWCPFFGITLYDSVNDQKKFILPIDKYKGNFVCIADIYDCDANWHKLNNLYKENYQKLLDGDQIIEPEGYIVHIFGDNDEWIPIKYKYKIYYIAHKPESKHNLQMALELSSNPKYKLLCERLAKFREKPAIKEILITLIDIIDKILDIIKKTSNIFKSNVIIKKNWVIYWKNESKEINLHFSCIRDNIIPFYNQFKNIEMEKRIFPFLMKLYEKLELDKSIFKLINLNNYQLIELINDFVFTV
jgi:energy-coupling factor transporter ATP-binding protein EcfA2